MPARLPRLIAASAIATLLVGAPLTACAALASTATEMACCLTATGECMPGMSAAACCDGPLLQGVQQATATARFAISVPRAPLAPVPAGARPAAAPPRPFAGPGWTADASSPPGSTLRHPTYVLLSTFRI
jgi:hypothetical protein